MKYLEIIANNLKKAGWSYLLRVGSGSTRSEQFRLPPQSAGAITERKENIYEATDSL
jgi:hypothetical protein